MSLKHYLYFLNTAFSASDLMLLATGTGGNVSKSENKDLICLMDTTEFVHFIEGHQINVVHFIFIVSKRETLLHLPNLKG